MIRLAIFLSIFTFLQLGYRELGGTPAERFFLETAGSRPAAWTIDRISPEITVVARGPSLASPSGSINVRNGCEGTETLFLLLAAFLAAPLGWKVRWTGIAVGIAGVLLLNHLRIVGLFYAFRTDPRLFDFLHTLGAPLLMTIIVALYFHALLILDRPAPPSPR